MFNSFRVIIIYYKILNGVIKKGDNVRFVSTGTEYFADEVGVLKLKMTPKNEVKCGDVGYIITGIKTAKDVKVGDTLTLANNPGEMIQGFVEVKPMVFAGIFPVNTDEFAELRDCMEKLQLNDASLIFELETSQALGFGFRCGFLALLHLGITRDSIEREFNVDISTTAPSVIYHINLRDGTRITLPTPVDMPVAMLLEPC